MVRINPILLTISILTSVVCGQNWFQTQRIEKQFNQAVEQYNEGRYAIARSLLEKVLSSPAGDYEAPALLLTMKTNVGMENFETAKRIGRNFLEKYPQSEYVKDVFLTYGDLFINEGNFPSAYRMVNRSRKLGTEPSFVAKTDQRLLKLIQLNLPQDILTELLSLETDPVSRQIHTLALGYTQIQKGFPDQCALTLSSILIDNFPNSFLSLYDTLLRASYQPARPMTTVGLVLPLSGRDGDKGRAFLTGFQERLSQPSQGNHQLTLMVLDNKSDPFQSVRAVRKLSGLEQVSVLAGPLNDKAVLAASAAAQSEQIPILIPGSTQDGLGEIYDHVFQLNSNLSTRGILAAQYAVISLGLDSLAVISPADEFGQLLTDAFIKEVDRLGKSVVITEWYSGPPKNLSRQFKSIRKRAFSLLPEKTTYDDFLGMEIDSLDALFDISADDFFNLSPREEKEISREDSAKIILSTIQGIYLPIHEGDVEYLGPQFPIYYLDTQLIGNEHWQDLSMLTKDNIGPHIKGITLVTNSFLTPTSPSAPQEDSEEFYRGYDTAGILLALNLTDNSRRGISNALSSLPLFRGISQFYATQSERPNLNVALQVLEFNGEDFIHRGHFSGDSLSLVPIETP